MQKPAFIFDGRLLLEHDELIRIGFHVHCIGKRLPKPITCSRNGSFYGLNSHDIPNGSHVNGYVFRENGLVPTENGFLRLNGGLDGHQADSSACSSNGHVNGFTEEY